MVLRLGNLELRGLGVQDLGYLGFLVFFGLPWMTVSCDEVCRVHTMAMSCQSLSVEHPTIQGGQTTQTRSFQGLIVLNPETQNSFR